MPIKISTWNINSVRLRIDLVAKFLKSARPDVLCLQETKCPDDAFPLKRFHRLGYEYSAINGQKGYHGVAILSRVPFERFDVHSFCGKTDCRHISVVLGEKAGLKDPLTVHNFYVPAGGDEPDPEINVKFKHKLDFLDEMREHKTLHPKKSQRAILVGDLNVAPLEHDVWSHKQMLKVVSHTPIECEKFNAARIAADRAHAHSQSSCWRYVKQALLAAKTIDSYPKTAYAKQAGAELTTSYGFKKLNISDPYAAPLGAVIVYGGRGAGHVEIRTPAGFVSDFQTPRASSRPLIGVFVKPRV